MKTERFHLGAVLSMTTGKLLCQMDDIYRIVQHFGGEPVWTHQLGRVMTESRPYLLAQSPALAVVTGDEVTPENFAGRLYERIERVNGELPDVADAEGRAREHRPDQRAG